MCKGYLVHLFFNCCTWYCFSVTFILVLRTCYGSTAFLYFHDIFPRCCYFLYLVESSRSNIMAKWWCHYMNHCWSWISAKFYERKWALQTNTDLRSHAALTETRQVGEMSCWNFPCSPYIIYQPLYYCYTMTIFILRTYTYTTLSENTAAGVCRDSVAT